MRPRTLGPWEILLSNYCSWLEHVDRHAPKTPESEMAQAIRRALELGVHTEHEARLVLRAAGSYEGLAGDLENDAILRIRCEAQLFLNLKS